MKDRKLIIFSLACFLILATVPVALCRIPPIIYVSGDGTGDYKCNGTCDQIQINQALQFVSNNPGYTTVHLKGPFIYVINDSILIGSNTILEGDSSAVIKLADNAGWDEMKPLIRQKSNSGNSNITVRGFEVNGNYAGNSNITLGRGYYNVMYFTYCNDIRVYNMYMHDGTGDGLRVNKGKNIQFYNNTIYKLGHDGLFAIRSENVEAWNNRITCRTNSALRVWNTNNVKFHDNVIDSFYHWSAGGPGIQIEKDAGIMDNIEIYDNTIHNTYGPGIWIYNYDNSSATQDQGKNVHIYHNVFYNTGTNPSINWVGGIVASGFHDTLIENNVFDGCYGAAITHMFSPNHSPNGGFTTIVRNNIIINTQKRTKDSSGTGFGIINCLPETHAFVLENNCLYNNVGGNYKNANSTTDIYADPLFADLKNHNYHLKSKAGRWDGAKWVNDNISSPCIDAGYPQSDYSSEPEPNGKRINIGFDGNTCYASKSDSGILISVLSSANFSCNVTSGYTPLSAAFTDTSTGNPITCNWNFGDGTGNSTQKNPIHTFSKAGSYTVTLTTNNEAGSSTVRKMNYITARTLSPPIATFSANVTSGTEPLTVLFSDRSTGGSPASRNWSFGDGYYSTETNPVHTYSKAGRYTVSLTVSNSAGSNRAVRSRYITVTALKTPVAAFSASRISGKAPVTVAFTDKSTGSPTSYLWDFGDKSSPSTARNPVHVYSKAGKYTIKLTVSNAKGDNTVTKSGYITVR